MVLPRQWGNRWKEQSRYTYVLMRVPGDLRVQQVVVCTPRGQTRFQRFQHTGELVTGLAPQAFPRWSGVHEKNSSWDFFFFFTEFSVSSFQVFLHSVPPAFIWDEAKSAHKWFHNASLSNHVYKTKHLSETEIEQRGLHISVKHFESPLCIKAVIPSSPYNDL